MLFAGGLALVAGTMLDALWTTLTSGGAGPLTSRLTSLLWHGALSVHRRSPRHGLLTLAGMVIVLAVVASWIVGLWAGWSLLFAADPAAVSHADTGRAASASGRIYFSGYTLFTLGIGDYVPREGFWQVVTALASLNGLFLITLSITYLVPVVSAAAEKRRLAVSIYDLGSSAAEVLRRAWNGGGFEALDSYLAQLHPMIEMHAERHLTYPVLHYFHGARRRAALGPSLAVLDEALLLLTAAVDPSVRPPPLTIEAARNGVAGLLTTLHHRYFRPAEAPPPPPSLEPLRAAGIPTVSDEEFEAAVERQREHRTLLRAFVEDGGWSWADVQD